MGVLRQLCSGLTTGVGAVLRPCAWVRVLMLVLTAALLLPASVGAVPPGTVITNSAQADYGVGGTALSSFSNPTTTITVVQRTVSNLELLQFAPTHPNPEMVLVPATLCSDDGTPTGTFTPLPPPHPPGSAIPIDLSVPLPLVPSSLFQKQEPIFLRLTDVDQNIDPALRETIHITLLVSASAEREFLCLIETGPDTGIFIGYIQAQGDMAVAPYDGYLTVPDEAVITAAYTDPADGSDTTAAGALVDPFGMVFDSRTGQPVDGATVTLTDVATGLPAVIYADNGVDIFPASVTSGGTATDSGGRVYNFPPGGYRFPLVAPGTYRLDVGPPAGYAAPSTVPTATLQALPGAPFAIVDPGSRGEPFVINPGPAIHIDLPVDSSASGLWLRKTASRENVAIGDFLQYRLTLENLSAAVLANVVVADRLPLGFRFQKQSARRDDAAPVTALVSADGRTLSFDLGSLAANTDLALHYVVEIAAGARPGRAINRASASAAGGITSNTAAAEVTVREDLFRSSAIIVGRVTADDCDPGTASEDLGIQGVRIYLEDGTYSITDEKGRYHFEGVTPGTHVVQLDLETLPAGFEIVMCEPNNRFAGRPYAQFVDLQGGTLWRADFHTRTKPPPLGQIHLQINSTLEKNRIQYQVEMIGQVVPVANLRLTLMLPEAVVYVPGSSFLDEQPLAEPQVNGNVLVYRLDDTPDNWQQTLRLQASLEQQISSGDHNTQAVLLFDTPAARNQRTPLVTNRLSVSSHQQSERQPEIILRPQFKILSAELSTNDQAQLAPVVARLRELKIIHIYLTGHTDNVRIRPRARHLFADNYALSLARAHSVEQYLVRALNLAPDQTTLTAKGPDEPIADNQTPEGRALNRRVELRVVAEKISSDTQVHLPQTHDLTTTTTQGLAPGIPSPVLDRDAETKNIKPLFDEAWLATATPGRTWLWPAEGEGPPVRSTKIVIQHHPGNTPQLLLDGQAVSPLNFDGMLQNTAGTIAISQWRGVDLQEGDNGFAVVILDPSGKEVGRMQRTVHYAGPPIRATLLEQQSHLVADGKTPPIVAVRLMDKDGYPTREGLVGDFSVDPPFAPYRDETDSQALSLTGLDLYKPHYKVGRDGIAYVKLQPTSQSGEVVLRLPFIERTQEVRLWLQPEQRDWILVGLAEGTVGYDSVSGNMENLDDALGEDGLYDDGRLAFFAKGRIKGKWLLTLAYDSTKDKDQQRLDQTIDPDTYYTLYGDATRQGYDAASREKLYLKIERDQFYALFGDFTTGLTVTQLSRYSRSLTGLKSELRTEHYSFNLFGSETDQVFMKDEIQGDGTSGLYRLSRRKLVINSEKVIIETRDRFRSEVILASRGLARHVDYNIDYDAGTIFFKEPIYSRDQNFNPVFIVVDYETRDTTYEAYNYGGRGAVKLLDQKLEVGATYVHEDQLGGEGDLGGVDVTYDVTENTQIKAEVATTRKDLFQNETRGDAYLAEVHHHSAKLDGKIYLREQGKGFGLGQQSGSEDSTRKIGLDTVYRFDSGFKIGGLAYRQSNLFTSAERDAAELNAFYTKSGYNLRAGLREASDRMGDGSVYRSTQLLGGVGYRLLDNRLQLRLDHDQSLANNDNQDYPTRTVLGADYQVTSQTALFGEQEFTYGASQNTQGTRVGLKTMPWAGSQVGTSLERKYNENGQRVLANLGLAQTWQVNERWSVSAGLDRSQTLSKDAAPRFNINVPPAVGAVEDFTAVSLGTSYKESNWSWASRIETRQADTEDKWGIIAGMYVEPEQGLGLSAGAQIFRTDAAVSGDTTQGDLRLGLAYRPLQTRWIFLDRLDYIFEEQTDDTFTFDTWRLVNNFNANYKPNYKTQIALQYGLKYVQDRFDQDLFSGFTDLLGVEGRYDLTERWDVGVRGSVLHSWNAEQLDYSTGLSVGYQVMTNAWVSVGYNFAGFRDEDFSNGSFTAQGPFIRFRIKLDQDSARRALTWFER